MLKSVFNKVAGQKACHFIKKRHQHRCFLVKFAKFLGTSFFTEHLQWLLPIIWKNWRIVCNAKVRTWQASNGDQQVMKPNIIEHTYAIPHLMKNNIGIDKQKDVYTVQLPVPTFQILTNINKYWPLFLLIILPIRCKRFQIQACRKEQKPPPSVCFFAINCCNVTIFFFIGLTNPGV